MLLLIASPALSEAHSESLLCMSKNMYFEARNDGDLAMLLVGQVTLNKNLKDKMMKKIELKRLQRVEAPKDEYKNIVAFQIVEFTIDFYGNKQTFDLDTKITKDEKQLVISGNGFIEDGYDITSL